VLEDLVDRRGDELRVAALAASWKRMKAALLW
jgi:hypothetical protein